MRKTTTIRQSAWLVIMIILSINFCLSQGDPQIQTMNASDEVITNVSHGNVTNTQRVLDKPLYDDPLAADHFQLPVKAKYKNLEVVLLYGATETDKKKYVTLNDALKDSMVKVHETGSVNNLQISNYSSEYIYINSGDIVRGGKQDRTIKYDIVIAPYQKNMPLASFCVEHGRWSDRDGNVGYFSSSTNIASDSQIKLAVRYDQNQSKVWSEVADYQESANVGVNTSKKENNEDTVDIKSKVSATSLELTLENEDLKKLKTEYKTHLLEQFQGQQDAVGLAYFINGKLYGMDIYNNHQLFADMSDKLIEAAIAEAISITTTPSDTLVSDVNTLKDLLKADAKVFVEEKVNEITEAKISQHNTIKNMVIFTTTDKMEKTWLHRNWIVKD